MLRILMAISLISLTLSCARKDAGNGLVKLSGRNPAHESENASSPHKQTAFDSTYYIGYVDYFPDTREFYTALFYREGHEYPEEDLLESKLDSLIVSDDDWARERLPMDEAKKLLVLSGLDTLLIFNRDHQAVCRCPLTRVEYLWNGMESYFIAIFKANDDFQGQTEELYGVSADFPFDNMTRFMSEEISDASFNEYLIKTLNVGRDHDWDMRHYRVTPPTSTFSIMSTYSMESNEAQSYLTCFEKNSVSILNEEHDNYHFVNILPLPMQMNGKPLLLITAGYPSSDVLWDYLAGFNGTRYEAIDYNRVHLKEVSPQWPLVLSQAESR
jgi:hypothetical protein